MTYRRPANAIRFHNFMLSRGKIIEIGDIIRWIVVHQVEEAGGGDD
jgi:hypothetical protein